MKLLFGVIMWSASLSYISIHATVDNNGSRCDTGKCHLTANIKEYVLVLLNNYRHYIDVLEHKLEIILIMADNAICNKPHCISLLYPKARRDKEFSDKEPNDYCGRPNTKTGDRLTFVYLHVCTRVAICCGIFSNGSLRHTSARWYKVRSNTEPLRHSQRPQQITDNCLLPTDSRLSYTYWSNKSHMMSTLIPQSGTFYKWANTSYLQNISVQLFSVFKNSSLDHWLTIFDHIDNISDELLLMEFVSVLLCSFLNNNSCNKRWTTDCMKSHHGSFEIPDTQHSMVCVSGRQHCLKDNSDIPYPIVNNSDRQYPTENNSDRFHLMVDNSDRQYSLLDNSDSQYSLADNSDSQYSLLDNSDRQYSNEDRLDRQYSIVDHSDGQYSIVDDHSDRQYSIVDHSDGQYSIVDHSDRQYSILDHSDGQYSIVDHSDGQYSPVHVLERHYFMEDDFDLVNSSVRQYSVESNSDRQYSTEKKSDRLYLMVDTSDRQYCLVDNSDRHYSLVDNSDRQYSVVDNSDRHYSLADNSDRQYSLVDNSDRQYSLADNSDRQYSLVDNSDRQYSLVDNSDRQYSLVENSDRQYSNVDHSDRQYSLVHVLERHFMEDDFDKQFSIVNSSARQYSIESNSDSQYSMIDQSDRQYSTENNSGRLYLMVDNSDRQYSNVDHSDRQYSIESNSDRQYSMIDQSNRQYSTENNSDRQYSNVDNSDRQYSNVHVSERHYFMEYDFDRKYSIVNTSERQCSKKNNSDTLCIMVDNSDSHNSDPQCTMVLDVRYYMTGISDGHCSTESISDRQYFAYCPVDRHYSFANKSNSYLSIVEHSAFLVQTLVISNNAFSSTVSMLAIISFCYVRIDFLKNEILHKFYVRLASNKKVCLFVFQVSNNVLKKPCYVFVYFPNGLRYVHKIRNEMLQKLYPIVSPSLRIMIFRRYKRYQRDMIRTKVKEFFESYIKWLKAFDLKQNYGRSANIGNTSLQNKRRKRQFRGGRKRKCSFRKTGPFTYGKPLHKRTSLQRKSQLRRAFNVYMNSTKQSLNNAIISSQSVIIKTDKMARDAANNTMDLFRLRWFPHQILITVFPFLGSHLANEFSRVATYANFPTSAPVSALRLARAGFFYTGRSDVVECFHCHVQHGNWETNDIPFEIHQRISRSCDFILGNDTANTPIDRSSSHSGPHTGLRGVTSLAQSTNSETSVEETLTSGELQVNSSAYASIEPENSFGFLSTGSECLEELHSDSIGFGSQCTENSLSTIDQEESGSLQQISTAASQTSSFENRALSMNRNINGISSAAVISKTPTKPRRSDSPRMAKVTKSQTRQQVATVQLKPLNQCNDRPKYIAFAVITVRMSSFKGWSSYTGQTPRELAAAGLFYTGCGDLVRCWFCGISLQSWETDDDPWIEHAKWAPTCLFLRQSKGDEFIQLVHERNNFCSHSNSTPNIEEIRMSPIQNDPEEIQTPLHLAATVERVKAMGYSTGVIQTAIEMLQIDNTPIDTNSIVNELIENEENYFSSKPDRVKVSELTWNTAVNAAEVGSCSNDLTKRMRNLDIQEHTRLMEENRRLKMELKCKICLDVDAVITFVPCGHMVCCEECGNSVSKCPVCRHVIESRVKTWMS